MAPKTAFSKGQSMTQVFLIQLEGSHNLRWNIFKLGLKYKLSRRDFIIENGIESYNRRLPLFGHVYARQ